ncbi:Uncharacterized protein ToN1_49210 [Aromatoleum petrolei]|nr:Uncharacterized protein ToN1_49210 [Aromatoleum petrolei]
MRHEIPRSIRTTRKPSLANGRLMGINETSAALLRSLRDTGSCTTAPHTVRTPDGAFPETQG